MTERPKHVVRAHAINWNRVEDEKDAEVWDRLTSNFWLSEKVPVSNDLQSWGTLTPNEQKLTTRVFTGLTLLDTIQGTVGAVSLIPDAITPHEESVYANIAFMECFTAEHELLTPKGWKSIKDITVEDQVAQYDPETKTAQFVHPVQVSTHTPSETYLISSPKGHVRQHVSGGHRVVLEKAASEEWVLGVIEAKELDESNFTAGSRFIHAAPLASDGDDFNDDDLIALSNEISKTLDGAKFSELFDLSSKSSSWCRGFIKALTLPYSIEASANEELTHYSENTDDTRFIVAAATLAGMRTNVEKTEAGEKITISLSEVHSSAEGVTVKKLPGEPVYGVEVPSTYLLTRNGSSVLVSGNCVHAKSYSSIFSTLISTQEIDDAFRWSEDNENLQRKAGIILDYYHGDDPLKRKVASTLLESFLFYSGFYLPMYWSSRAKLTNTADLIRLIIRDEAVHGYYIGYKYQIGLAKETPERQEEMKAYTYDLLLELYENEVQYTADLYDELGLTEDVKKFLRYNANKALMNLGYDPLFPKDDTDVNPAILSALSPNADENHDFFSGSGSSYVMGKAVTTEDEDWDF